MGSGADMRDCPRIAELRAAIALLVQTARVLAQRRTASGALSLSSQEIRVAFDESKQTVTALQESVDKQRAFASSHSTRAQKHIELHDTVAECMIFANQAVAERISTVLSSKALLRRHPLPESVRRLHATSDRTNTAQINFANLIECARAKGFTIDPTTNFTLARSIDACFDAQDPSFNKLIR